MAVIVSPARSLESARLERLARGIAIAVAIAIVVYYGIRVGRHASRGPGGDWGVYYRSGVAFLAGDPLYTLEQGPFLTFKYSPAVAMATAPLALLPPVLARLIWLAADVGLLAVLVWVTFQLLGPSRSRSSTFWIVAAAVALTGRYIQNQWHAGSSATFWIAATALASLALVRERPASSGMALAIGFMWKLVPLCFLPLLALDRRRFSAVGGFVVGVAVLAFVPALWIGWDMNLAQLADWPDHLMETETPAQVWRVQNQSVYAQLARFFSETPYDVHVLQLPLGEIRGIWLAASIAAAAALYAWIVARQRSQPAGNCNAQIVALLLIYMTLFNPLAWRYNFIALLVPYIVVLQTAVTWRERRATLLGLAIAAWLLGSLPAENSGIPGVVTLHALGARLWGTGLLGLAVALTVRPRERDDERYEVIGPVRIEKPVFAEQPDVLAETPAQVVSAA